MITRLGQIMEALDVVKEIHPEARWDADGHRLSIIIPADFDVEKSMADMSRLLAPKE